MPTEEKRLPINGEETGTVSPEIIIRPLQTSEDKAAFKRLNEEWITHYFVLEEKDREVLSQPEKMILDKGGQIYMACAGNDPVGCVALIPMGDGVYELSKMAVSPVLRGFGIGRRLLEFAVIKARENGARSLFLGSNSILKNAVHLYESIGFRHVPAERLPPMKYARADVFMEMIL
jgi:N-acetylglutamate synthase-like GNAT family acetyltransferase